MRAQGEVAAPILGLQGHFVKGTDKATQKLMGTGFLCLFVFVRVCVRVCVS